MNRIAIIDAWRGLSGMSRAALGLLAVALVILLLFSPPVLAALFAGSLDPVEKARRDGPEVLAYTESVEKDVDFISRRSPFFAPAAPPRAPVVRNTTPPPPIDRKPTSYGGPKLVGLIGPNGAMFATPVYQGEPFIKIGEKGLVELVSIQHPWKAKVRWGGGEFELNLFDRLESLPIVNYGGAVPIGRPSPSPDVFGGGTAATSSGGLDFGGAAGDSDAENN